eukprot:SAG22_NODE_4329_length_1301_cov_1.410150_2_plen_203_part_00
MPGCSTITRTLGLISGATTGSGWVRCPPSALPACCTAPIFSAHQAALNSIRSIAVSPPQVLRISTDLNLGCAIWDIPQGADYLETNVPMDKGTAEEDAWMYLATPGLGLSYGIGKAQIMRYLALARQHHDETGSDGGGGGPFDLRGFHDSLWTNGNVPIELQAYEILDGDPPPAIRRLIAIAAGQDEQKEGPNAPPGGGAKL